MQAFYIMTMLVEGRAQDKVRLAGDGEGAHLWQLLYQEHEPRTASRRTVLIQQVLNFQWTADVLKSIDDFDILVRRCEVTSGQGLADETKHGTLINGLASVPDEHAKKLADHNLFNMERLHD